MAAKKFSISYDKEADVVYLSFGHPTQAISEEFDNGIFARYDPKTEKLVGLTITNFSRKFDTLSREVSVPNHRKSA